METDREWKVFQIIWPDLILFLFILSIDLMVRLISNSILNALNKSFDGLNTRLLIKDLFCYSDKQI